MRRTFQLFYFGWARGMPQTHRLKPSPSLVFKLLVLVTVLVAIPGDVLADSAGALAAYRRGDVATATGELSTASRADDSVLTLLSELFVRHRERKKDGAPPHGDLVRALARLVEESSPQAQYQLYDLARDGQDSDKALRWLERAAAAGYPEAQFDYVNTAKSQFPAKLRLDLVLRASRGGSLRAKLNLAVRYEGPSRFSARRPADDRNLMPVDRAESFRLAMELATAKPRSLYPDDARLIRQGKVLVARAYYFGVGIQTNYAEAFRWAETVASEEREAAALLWQMYREGKGVAKDAEKAKQWCDALSKSFRSDVERPRCDE